MGAKKRLLKLLEKRTAKKAEIVKMAEKTESVEELRSLNAEIDAIDIEIRELNEAIADIKDDEEEGDEVSERTRALGGEIPSIVAAGSAAEKRGGKTNEIEKRVETMAQELRSGKEVTIDSEVMSYLEKRSVTTANVVLENKYKREIAENFNGVAQTIDLVDSVPMTGGGSYTVVFQITDGDAGETAEGEEYTNDEGTFGEASTGKAKITNSAIVDEEVVELPNADYLSKIINNVRKSIRKKVSGQIISGKGGENSLLGVYGMPIKLIPESYKVEISEIGKSTLRDIVFAYGGDEDVEAPETLFLNKKDLQAFAAIMAGDERPYFSIEYNGPSGYIQESGNGLKVPYTVNSACKSIKDAIAGDKTMVYGNPKAYEMPLFSRLTIKRSDERYIERGKVGFFGKIIVGGILNSYKSFIPVVKK